MLTKWKKLNLITQLQYVQLVLGVRMVAGWKRFYYLFFFIKMITSFCAFHSYHTKSIRKTCSQYEILGRKSISQLWWIKARGSINCVQNLKFKRHGCLTGCIKKTKILVKFAQPHLWHIDKNMPDSFAQWTRIVIFLNYLVVLSFKFYM